MIKAKENIYLMIELKTTGHHNNIENSFIELIKKYQCLIASMDINVLKKVKELEPSIETVYISAILVTNRYDLKFVDVCSIETTSLSYEMVVEANLQGKKIYSWTANTEHSIKKALRCVV